MILYTSGRNQTEKSFLIIIPLGALAVPGGTVGSREGRVTDESQIFHWTQPLPRGRGSGKEENHQKNSQRRDIAATEAVQTLTQSPSFWKEEGWTRPLKE